MDGINLVARFESAASIDLQQGISLIPMTEELFDEVNSGTISNRVGEFVFLNERVETKVLELMDAVLFAYIEADYFGGEGGQMAICWEKNQRVLSKFDFLHGQINEALKMMGVVKGSAVDEFMAVGLNRYRYTEDWVND